MFTEDAVIAAHGAPDAVATGAFRDLYAAALASDVAVQAHAGRRCTLVDRAAGRRQRTGEVTSCALLERPIARIERINLT